MAPRKHLLTGFAIALSGASSVYAAVPLWGQCGGIGYTGDTTCAAGSWCESWNPYFSQCEPLPVSSGHETTTSKTSSTSKSTSTSKTTSTSQSTSTSKTSSTTSSSSSSTITSTSSTVSASATPSPLKGLNLLAKAKGRYFGTSLDGIWLNTDLPYLALSGNFSEFGMVTPGNAQKWDTIEPSQSTFVYTNADYIVSWSHNRSQTLRGHNLVWYSQLPSWLTSGTWTNDTLIAVMQNHIQNEGGHFKGQLYCWDVVNEPWNDDGTWRATPFYNTIGPAYIPIALTTAHQTDPGAKLYINDYNIEGVSAKSTAMYNLAVQLLGQGIPLDGIGCQGHLIVGLVPGDIATNYARFAALGLEWALTELDVRVTLPTTPALLAQQATDYANVVSACVGSAACVGITTWDTSDDYSWVPGVFTGQGAPLLFDENKQPKPAYYSVASVLAGATISGNFNSWYTPGSSSTTTTVSATKTTSVASSTTTSVTSTTSAAATPSPLKALNLLAKAQGRYFGTALDGIWSNTDQPYLALSGNFSEFGVVTPGNAMKWDATEPSQNTFTFTNADYLVSWSHKNGQAVRGHNFVWYSQLPNWLTSGTWTNDTLITVMQNHIQNEGGHFKGQLYGWDVVNEPWNDDGTWRATPFYNTIGPAYIPIALTTAHTTDPSAKLYINDYNIEGVSAKSTSMYNLAVQLLSQGVPLHGIGCQGHLIVGLVPGDISTNYARFAALGLEWALTELDVRITLPATTALLAQQAADYANVVAACVGSPACVGITTWDTSDDYSWVPGVFTGQGAALLFDANKQPKLAYYSVASVLASATVGGSFNGWYGTAPSTTTAPSSSTSAAPTTTSSASSTPTPSPLKGLNKLAKAKGRYFGTALDGIWSNTDAPYLALSGNFSEFGMVTPGNAMKWDSIEPSQGTFVYTHADYLVSWAHNNSQTVRGHNFVWYSQLPSWVTSGTWTNDTLIAVMQNHIVNEGGHFKGQLYGWDVVNEPWNDDGTWRATPFYNTIGPAYVPIALNTAHTTDPSAKLYINDYNIEGVSAKSTAMYNLAVQLLAQGVPLHGIGCQGHLIVGLVPGDIATNYARFAALGLEWALTELDVRITLPTTTALLAQQATDYANVVAACVGSAACVGITTWDTSDDYSWVPGVFTGQGAPLLFDANKQPKPAYYSVANVLAAATVSGPFTDWQ